MKKQDIIFLAFDYSDTRVSGIPPTMLVRAQCSTWMVTEGGEKPLLVMCNETHGQQAEYEHLQMSWPVLAISGLTQPFFASITSSPDAWSNVSTFRKLLDLMAPVANVLGVIGFGYADIAEVDALKAFAAEHDAEFVDMAKPAVIADLQREAQERQDQLAAQQLPDIMQTTLSQLRVWDDDVKNYTTLAQLHHTGP